VTHQKD